MLNKFQSSHGANLLYGLLPLESTIDYQRSVSKNSIIRFDDMFTKAYSYRWIRFQFSQKDIR